MLSAPAVVVNDAVTAAVAASITGCGWGPAVHAEWRCLRLSLLGSESRLPPPPSPPARVGPASLPALLRPHDGQKLGVHARLIHARWQGGDTPGARHRRAAACRQTGRHASTHARRGVLAAARSNARNPMLHTLLHKHSHVVCTHPPIHPANRTTYPPSFTHQGPSAGQTTPIRRAAGALGCGWGPAPSPATYQQHWSAARARSGQRQQGRQRCRPARQGREGQRPGQMGQGRWG
jgi:hypothetical protein